LRDLDSLAKLKAHSKISAEIANAYIAKNQKITVTVTWYSMKAINDNCKESTPELKWLNQFY
jgi:Zn-dependent peptidase ImmA (M78 family)